MIAARYASLLAFAQSRGADCGRDEGGKFGSGNKCQVTDGVLKPGTAEPHDSEPSFGDGDDDHVYHVTTAGNAESILSGGFKQSPHTVKGGSYESYSKGKVFFTEKSGLATWKSKIEDHLFHSHDDPPPVAIVKVKKSEVEHLLKPDEIGTKDAGAKAYYVDLSGRKKEGRGFCPTGPGGGIDNSCGSGTPGSAKASVGKSGGLKLAPPGEVSKRFASGEQSSKVLQDLGFRKMNFTDIDKAIKSADKTQRQRILADLDSLAEAIKISPQLADVPIRVGPGKEIFKNMPEAFEALAEDDGSGILGAVADAVSGSIAVLTDHDEYDASEYDEDWNSSTHRSASIIHEMAHIEHFRSVVAQFPHPGEDELPGVSPLNYAMTTAEAAGNKLLKSDKSLRDKVRSVSEYATTDVFEFVAEYSSGVALGDVKSDKDLDRLCKAVGARPPRRIVK